jgi:hypothetical protein
VPPTTHRSCNSRKLFTAASLAFAHDAKGASDALRLGGGAAAGARDGARARAADVERAERCTGEVPKKRATMERGAHGLRGEANAPAPGLRPPRANVALGGRRGEVSRTRSK